MAKRPHRNHFLVSEQGLCSHQGLEDLTELAERYDVFTCEALTYERRRLAHAGCGGGDTPREQGGKAQRVVRQTLSIKGVKAVKSFAKDLLPPAMARWIRMILLGRG